MTTPFHFKNLFTTFLKSEIIKKFKENVSFFVFKAQVRVQYQMTKFYQKSKGNFSKSLLLWDMGGLSAITHWQGALGMELRRFNFKSQQVICDGLPLACIQRGVDVDPRVESWQESCSSCQKANQLRAMRWGITPILPRKIVPSETIQELKIMTEEVDIVHLDSLVHRDIPMKDMIITSVIRYFKGERNSIEDIIKDEYGNKVLRKYIFAAYVGIELAHRLMANDNIDAILLSHGVFVDYMPIVEVAKSHEIPTATWYSGKVRGSIYIVDSAKWRKNNNDQTSKSLPLISTTELQIKSRDLHNYLQKRYSSTEMRDIFVKNTGEGGGRNGRDFRNKKK